MSNKFSKLAVLSVLGLLSLTACSSSSSEIYAKPTNYKETIINVEGSTEDIHNNILSIIYDAMHDGSVGSKVLAKVLYAYAESVYGVYNPVTRKAGSTEVTLKDAYLGTADGASEAQVAKLKEFIRKHKAYWYYNDDGKHINDAGEEVKDANFEPCSVEIKNVKTKWDDIENRIASTMFSKVKSGTYTSRSYFDEGKLLKALYEEGKKVNFDRSKKDYKKQIVWYTVEEEEVFSADILTRAYYQDSVSCTDDYSNVKYTYIEDEILETIYGDLLIEQYLLDEDLSAIRNSRAREINVLKIEKYSSNSLNADRLVQHLVNAIYADAPTGDHVRTDKDTIDDHYDELFETYAKVAKGLYDEIAADVKASAIVTDLNTAASDVYEVRPASGGSSAKAYYKNTTYGDLIEEYEKVLDNIDDYVELDKDLYSKYTDSGTRSLEEGLDQETIKIQQIESITKGWYIQSTAPSLPSTITDRLFTLSVANNKVEIGKESDGVKPETIADAIAELEDADRFYKDEGVWKLRTKPSEEEKDFLCSINGAYFLKFEGQYAGDDYKNDIVYDDGSAYYIVQVREAVKDVKLRNSQSASSYANTRGQEFLNNVIDTIAKKVGETGNYSTLSKTHWLKEMSIKYHDQAVYDYFKETYPDLFE